LGEFESETESLAGVLSVVENLDAVVPAAGADAGVLSRFRRETSEVSLLLIIIASSFRSSYRTLSNNI
jgi:hypothetical protein